MKTIIAGNGDLSKINSILAHAAVDIEASDADANQNQKRPIETYHAYWNALSNHRCYNVLTAVICDLYSAGTYAVETIDSLGDSRPSGHYSRQV